MSFLDKFIKSQPAPAPAPVAPPSAQPISPPAAAPISAAITPPANDGIIVTSMIPYTAETLPIIQRLVADRLEKSGGVLPPDHPDLLALKQAAGGLTSPFQRAVSASGKAYKIDGNARVSLWFRVARQGETPAPEDMVMLREAKGAGSDYFAATHIVYGARAPFAMALVPPCCDGESFLATFSEAVNGKRHKIQQSAKALELGVGEFFDNHVKIAQVAQPQALKVLSDSYAQITSQP